MFSETASDYFLRVAIGLGSTEVASATERDRKSISNETTFSGTSDREVLAKLVQSLCQELKSDMARKGFYGKVFTLKMKTTDFEVRTRAQTLHEYTQDEVVMNSVALKLLSNEFDAARASGSALSLRLLGVRMSNLIDKEHLSPKKQVTLRDLFKKSGEVPQNTSDLGKIQAEKSLSDDSFQNSETTILESSRSNEPTLEGTSQTSFEEESAEEASYLCPVCSKCAFNDMDALNRHLDVCLNASVVKELVKETHQTDALNPSIHTPTPTMFNSKFKRKPPLKNKSAKKIKGTPPVNTLHKYLDSK